MITGFSKWGTLMEPIKFKGKAAEYFGIWIVNLLLTVITIGIYGAWAKVRKKKYFLVIIMEEEERKTTITERNKISRIIHSTVPNQV